jgi:hypothetical protein
LFSLSIIFVNKLALQYTINIFSLSFFDKILFAMKNKRYLAAVLISFIIMNISCLALKNDRKTLLFELETTSCYGTCPVYKLQVYSNGYATLEGIEHLDKIGNYHSQIGQERINKLENSFENIGFFNLENSYTSNFTDLQTKYITWHKDGKSKQVMAYDNVPKDLKALIKELESLVKELNWNETK